jgi:hypothetical protein
MFAAKMVDQVALHGIKAIGIRNEKFEARFCACGSQHGVQKILRDGDAAVASTKTSLEAAGVVRAFDLQQDIVPAHFQLRGRQVTDEMRPGE